MDYREKIRSIHRERQNVIESKLIPAARAASSVLSDLGHRTSAGALGEALFQIEALDGQVVELVTSVSGEERMDLLEALLGIPKA